VTQRPGVKGHIESQPETQGRSHEGQEDCCLGVSKTFRLKNSLERLTELSKNIIPIVYFNKRLQMNISSAKVLSQNSGKHQAQV
jgi:hypothetical protein